MLTLFPPISSELELQAEETARQWRLENQAENATTGGSSESLPPSTAAPDIVDRNADSPFLATASPIRTGPGSGSGSRSIVAPGLHSDLTKFNNDCCSTTTTTTTSSSTMWDHYGMEILPPLQCGPGMYTTIPEESASTVTADSPFYSPPETCASPLSSSDGAAAFELSPIRSSSVLPGPANAFIDRYPENILKSNSPLHASGFRWDWCDGGLYESNPVSVSLDGDVIQPVCLLPVQSLVVMISGLYIVLTDWEQTKADSSIPIPIINLDDRIEQSILQQREPTSPGCPIIPLHDGMEVMDPVMWHCCQ